MNKWTIVGGITVAAWLLYGRWLRGQAPSAYDPFPMAVLLLMMATTTALWVGMLVGCCF